MSEGNRKKHIKQEEFSRRPRNMWDIRPYLPMVWTVVFIVFICLILFFIFLRYQGLVAAIKDFAWIMQAIIIGIFVGYLLNPVMKFFEHRIGPAMQRSCDKRGIEFSTKKKKRVRALCSAIAMIIFLAAITALLILIIPQIIMSVQDFVTSLEEKTTYMQSMIDKLALSKPELAGYINQGIDSVTAYVEKRIGKLFSGGDADSIEVLGKSITRIIKVIFNIIIGIMASFYILMRKEHFIGQVKKLTYGIFKPHQANVLMDVYRKADDIFGGFLMGDIIDSAIIGFASFFCMLVIGTPYAPMIALIVGITNLIPIFGPYFGAIPSALIILTVNPMQALYFLIMILVIQQIDGNILKPRILGDTLGLSPFWILVAIFLFGGLFGVMGMLFGVPVFALIYYIVKRIAEHVLRVRKLPPDTEDYINLDHIDLAENKVVEHKDAGRRTRHYWYHKGDKRRRWFRGRF